jgi:hypothetical protein
VILAPCLLAGSAASGQAPPDRPGPWDNDIVILESEDGFRFERKRTLVEGGGVASLILDAKGRLVAAFQWFPAGRPEAFDRVAVSISTDDAKSWSAPEPIVVDGFPADHRRPFDPTLVLLPRGEYRLYFTSHAGRDGIGPDVAERRLPAIYSATSTDAIHYRFEPGVRFRVEGETVIDCAAARLGEEWHLFSPIQGRQGKAYHAVSRNGLEFERLPDLELDVRGSWLGCTLAVDGGLRFFGTGGRGWSATSADGRSWRLDADGAGMASARYAGADPGVARARDGRYIMVATGNARGGGPGMEGGPPPARRPAPVPVMAANEHSVYVLRDGRLERFDARTLELQASIRLPDDRARGDGEERGREPHPKALPPQGQRPERD